jgi:hypothetical protein
MNNNFELHTITINDQEFILPLKLHRGINCLTIEFKDSELINIKPLVNFNLLGETYKCYFLNAFTDFTSIRIDPNITNFCYIFIKKFKND